MSKSSYLVIMVLSVAANFCLAGDTAPTDDKCLELRPSVESIGFGEVAVGDSVRQLIELQLPRANAEITQVQVLGLVAPFNFSGGVFPGLTADNQLNRCSPSPTESCFFEIEFSPYRLTEEVDAIEIHYLVDDKSCFSKIKLQGFGVN